jgi:hypothetical protein
MGLRTDRGWEPMGEKGLRNRTVEEDRKIEYVEWG